MKKNLNKLTKVLTASFLAAGVLAGCSTSQTEASKEAVPESRTAQSQIAENTAALEGTITMAGSTSMEKLANAAAESFMAKYPKVTVTAEFTGSSAGIEAVLAGTVDIGNSSRNLKDSEKEAGAVENIVAIDGIAVITDKENTVTDITSEDLAKVYTGEVTNWSELGGSDQPIVAIGREAGSGTRDAFEELLEVKDACKYAQELDSTGAVLAKVAATPGAIGYVSLDVVNDTVIGVKIDGVEPTEQEILAGNYLLQRPFVMATKGEIKDQNEVVKAWFDYIGSEEGKAVIQKVGLIIPQ